jgi:PAS domain S-box-containing protein
MSWTDNIAKAVLSTSSEAIVAADKRGTIIFWNPGAERIFGFGASEAVGQSLNIIIPERLRKRHWDGYYQVMATGKSRYDHGDILAVPGMKRDGTQISIEFTIVQVRDSAGELNGLVAIMRDATKSYEEVHALKKMLVEAREGSC